MPEWLNTFWGGALFVLAIVFCTEAWFAYRSRRLAIRTEARRRESGRR